MLQYLILACLLFFGVGLVAVEIIRKNQVPIPSSWVSTYLTGPDSWIEDAGFTTLAGAFILLPIYRAMPLMGEILFYIGGGAVFLTMLSRRYFAAWFSRLSAQTITSIHVYSAGVAFLGTALALLWVAPTESFAGSRSTYIILAATTFGCVDLLFFDKISNNTQWAEKAGAMGLFLASLPLVLL